MVDWNGLSQPGGLGTSKRQPGGLRWHGTSSPGVVGFWGEISSQQSHGRGRGALARRAWTKELPRLGGLGAQGSEAVCRA